MRTSRLASLFLLALAAACSSEAKVPCHDQATCVPYSAVCIDGYCHKPTEEGPDLSQSRDLGMAPDLTPMCLDNSSCTTETTPICDTATQSCRACKTDECAGTRNLCAPTGACVQCLQESDCTSGRVCGADGACTACAYGYQCGSGACGGGACVAGSDIVYVDNNQAPCTGADGTRAKAYCTIPDAIAALASRHYIVVVGSATPYAAFPIDGTSPAEIHVVGPGRGASPAATIGNGTGAIGMSGAAAGKTLALEGLDLIGRAPAGDYTDSIVLCAGGTLIVRGCRLHGTLGDAVSRNTSGDVSLVDNEIFGAAHASVAFQDDTGTLVLSGNIIHDNAGGFLAEAGNIDVQNNYMLANGGSASTPRTAGFTFKAGGTFVFAFNTLVGNDWNNGNTAVTCLGSALPITSSILVGNGKLGGTQITTCALTDVVTGTDTATGAIQKTPSFVSATDAHLVANDPANLDCCIDKLSAGPTLDFDGTGRPKGAGWDIGAHEVQ